MKKKICPKITIVTVTYNTEKYLEQTIKSIMEQDYPNIEYIIIDGASTDGTIDIIKKYEKYITYWISEPDNGIYDAMNKGIDIATGEWINFMNAGDSFCEKNTISRVLSNLYDSTDIISGDIMLIKENGNKIYTKTFGESYAYHGMFCHHQTMFVKINLMKKYKFDISFVIAGDYDFTLKCFNHGYNFQTVNFAVANFLDDGVSNKYLLKGKIEDIFIQSKYLNNINDIFLKKSYSIFKTFSDDNNYVFAQLFSMLCLEFERLDLKNKKFVLYGFGNIGQLIYQKFTNNIFKIVDNNYQKLNDLNIAEISNPNDLDNHKEDLILISVLGREEEIEKLLLQKNCNNIMKFNLRKEEPK